jgi:opacity protein-like surface antigen
MAYHRMWFADDKFAWNIGGGFMHNPGRYLVLTPTGQTSPIPQPLSIQGIQYVTPSGAFDTNTGTQFDAYDYETGIQYMPNEQITWDLEYNHRQSSVPFFAGHGGVTSPDGYVTTAIPAGWRPDLVKADDRIIAAMLVRF